MAKVALFVCLVLAVISLGGSQAASEKDENRTARQAADELYYDPYDLESLVADVPVYQPSPRIADIMSEGRSFYRNPFRYPLYKASFGYEDSQPQARLNGLGAAAINNLLFNNRFSNNRPRPLASLNNYIPVQWNPNFPNLATTFDSCTAPTGESGICAPGSLCSVFGGRPSGSCGLAGVCCVNAVSTCGSTVTLNNTYWQSPATPITGAGSCSVNVRLDQTLKEQKRAICQIRLDYVSFTISQPNAESVCNTDSFQVGGATNNVPTICGENANQHMYIHVRNSAVTPSDVRLIFNFAAGAGAVARSWNIKISMLPCGADYLAPTDCLQYFTSSSGTVRSFNWRDTPLAVRQLANQDYNICFRTELINSQSASTLCLTECTVANAGAAFRLSGSDPTSQPAPLAANKQCNNDFLVLTGAFDPATAVTAISNAGDRLCGGALNVQYASATSASGVCTTARPFRIYYRTNGDETVTANIDQTPLVPAGPGGVPPAVPASPANNMGFCLTFNLRTP